MDAGWLEQLRARHEEALERVDRTARAVRSPEPLADVLHEFLAWARTRLTRLLLDEDRELGRLADRYLPPEIAPNVLPRRDHGTLRALVQAIRETAPMVERSPDAREDVTIIVGDMQIVLHEHVRRGDALIRLLLQQQGGFPPARDARRPSPRTHVRSETTNQRRAFVYLI